MIKNLSLLVNKSLLHLANMCLEISDIPDDWKNAQIYPIPKPYDWEHDITKTRPITLLETVRKLIVKIITNRLSQTIAQQRILRGNNFAEISGG